MNALMSVLPGDQRNTMPARGLIFPPGTLLRVVIRIISFSFGILKEEKKPQPYCLQLPRLGEACSHQLSLYPLSTLALEPCFRKSSQATGPGPSAACISPEFGAQGWTKLSCVDVTNEDLNSTNFVGSDNFD